MSKIYFLVLDHLLFLKSKILGSLFRPEESWSSGDRGSIILLHGYNENWYFMSKLGELLHEQGFAVYFPEFSSFETVEQVAKSISQFIDQNDLQNVTIIGHSKGGIIGRFLLTTPTGLLIKKLVNIATPNAGTPLANIKILSADELIPGSKFLTNLDQLDLSVRHKIVNIFPKTDSFFSSQSKPLLAGTKNMEVDVIGHWRILIETNSVKQIVHECLE